MLERCSSYQYLHVYHNCSVCLKHQTNFARDMMVSPHLQLSNQNIAIAQSSCLHGDSKHVTVLLETQTSSANQLGIARFIDGCQEPKVCWANDAHEGFNMTGAISPPLLPKKAWH